MSHSDPFYDLAVSFAGEQRGYVEEVVEACKSLGLTVLYDVDQTVELWGRNLITSLRSAYGGKQARYVAPFFSADYLAKPYPMDEYTAMLVPALENPDDYILPVKMGDVDIPAHLLSPAIGFLRAEDYTPAELARAFRQRINGSGSGRPTTGSAPSGATARPLRVPATIPANFSKYQELEESLRYLTERFHSAAPLLREAGFVCTIRNTDSDLRIRVERLGNTVYGLDIQLGGMGRDDVLNFVLDPRGWGAGRNSSNGTASIVFDRAAGVPRLEMHDLSVLGTSWSVKSYSKEELFEALWNRLVQQVEQLTQGH